MVEPMWPLKRPLTTSQDQAETPEPVDLDPGTFLSQPRTDGPLLDVRTPGEFAAGHLADSMNLDMMSPTFVEEVEALGLDREAPLYLYCRSGARSHRAAELLRECGFGRAYNVGGFEELVSLGARPAGG